MQSICPKESSLLDHVQKSDHEIVPALTTAAVNKNSDFGYIMVLTILLIIVPLVIDSTKEARINVVNTLPSLKFISIIN